MKYTSTEFAKAVSVVLPATYSAGAAAFSSGIDLQGYRECLLVFHLGAFTATGDVDFEVEDSADNSSFANIDLNADSTNDALVAEKTTTTDSTVYVIRINCEKVRRYIRVGYDVDDDTCDFGVSAILLDPKYAPASQVNTVSSSVN